WNLLRFASVDLNIKLKGDFIETFINFPFFFFIPKNWKERVKNKFAADIRLDTPHHATAAGFWYLHKEEAELAIEAFTIVRDLPYGEELHILAQTLAMFQTADDVRTIASLDINNFPSENLLRPTTWQVMNSLRRVVEDIKLIQHSASRNTKSLAYSRAIGELAEVINNQDQVLEAERALIFSTAQNWKQALEKIGKSIGDVAITKPVRNPYVIGNPVTGSLFVGREDILRQLEELWIMGNQLQSVVLYGHRRMGKTSILVNIAHSTGAEIKIIYLNLQRLGAVSQGVAEVLIAISDAIAKQLDIESPDDEAFLKLPQRTFERYLQQVIANMNYRGLIIALDEFETIEELIAVGQLDPRFMGFLRGLIQINPAKLAFAFAGLHTLEEMTADYFKPFFASVIPINVGFVSAGATKTLLANPVSIDVTSLSKIEQTSTIDDPDNDFLLDYTVEALDLIYSLTSGQPYLTQLIGFQLVRNYNDQVFEINTSRDPIFTVEDVESIITKSFFQQGRYYFEGVWGQASQDATGQPEIITALAPHPQGMTKDELISVTNLTVEQINQAIATLQRHDVIQELEGKHRIIVELFRRWVMMRDQ
ncbi:MAG: ATP-binding protein, partial [Cyanobacteria bacterium J06642_3]